MRSLLDSRRDLRFALRSIGRAPWLSAVVVASIALGLALNTTVFSWLQAVVLEPIPGVSVSRLRLVEPRTERGGYPGTSWLEYRDLTVLLPSFAALAVYRMAPLDVGLADGADRAYGLLVSGNYFAALGLHPARGRFITPEDAVRPGAEPIVVVSDRFWRTRLASAAIVGRTLRVNDRPLTVVGIAPPGFQGTVVGLAFDLWIPATAAPLVLDRTRELDARADREYSAFGVLAPGTTEARARTDLSEAMRRLAHDNPATNQTMTAELLPFSQGPRGPQRFLAGALGVLQAVMLLVLLAVCGTTANLTLARATSRRQEIGIRLALGASRWRIVSLLLSESLLLASAGTVAGVLLAIWGTAALRAVPMPTAFPIRFETHIDGLSALFAAGLGLASALTFGLAPALQLSGVDPRASITQAPATGHGRPAGGALMPILMAVEIGLALVVLALAGIFLERFASARTTAPGFTREGVLLTSYDLRERNRSVDADGSARFARDLLARLRTLPSVEVAAVASSVPLDIHGLPTRAFVLEGHTRPDGAEEQALTNTVTPEYFRTMRLALRQGTDFADLGDAFAPAEAVVNETFVRRFAPAMTVLGRRLESAGRTYTIVGVVADSIYEAFDEPPTPFIYLSYRDRAVPIGEIHLRPQAGSEAAAQADLRRAVRDLDPALTLYNVRTLTDNVDENLVFERIPARLFGLVGPLLLALSAIGISAVVAYAVAERQREIGVRLALGGTPATVTRGLLLDTMQVVGFGAAAGWAVAYVLDRDVVQSAHFDLLRLVVVPVGLCSVALVAAWLPARRAARARPLEAIRGRAH